MRTWKLSAPLALVLLAVGACSHTRPYFPEPVFQPIAEPEPGIGDALRARLILVGDAGEPDAPALPAVAEWARRAPEDTLVVYLGDNMYPEGLTPDRREEAGIRILPQIEAAVGSGARVLFVPGNHDWADGETGGLDAVRAQAEYIRSRVPHDDGFLPLDGCPGPVTMNAFPRVRIVAIDSQWWLHQWDKPREACSNADADSFRAALAAAVETNADVVIVAHHPLGGHGRHGGFFSLRDHLVPPVIGSMIALWRTLAPLSQDYASEPYRAMTELFRSALEARPPDERLRIWAAGHEHNLEIHESDVVDYHLISGSAAKRTPVGDGPDTLFALSGHGFMVIDFLMTDGVFLRVVEPDRVHGFWLRD